MAKKGKAKKRAAAEAVLGDAHGGAVRRGGGSGSGGAKRARPARPAWETLNWASVGGTEKVIHGAEDGAGGFMSLEVIDASEVDGFLALSGVGDAQAAASSGDVREKAVKAKKGGKAKATAAAAPPALADAAAPTERADAAERGAGTLAQRGQQKKKKKLRGPRNKKKAAALKQAKEAQRAAAKGAEGGDVAGTDTGAVERSNVLPASGASSLAGTAWAAFGLHPLLERGLADLGFTSPTPIQSECVPSAARGRSDIVGAAETGSGKTLAFGLPVLHRLLEERDALEADGLEPDARLRALIICPTRELALQVKDHMASVAKHVGKGLRVVPIVGGMAQQKQERLLRARPAVVVATPGRLWELMSNGDAHLSDLSGLRFFVLDEADRMVEHGHFAELESILERLPPHAGQEGAAGAAGGRTDLERAEEERERRRLRNEGVMRRVGNARGSLGAPIRKGGSEEDDGEERHDGEPHGSDVDGSDEEVEAIDLQGHDSEGDDKDAGGGVVETGYGGAGAGVDADEDHAAGDAPVRQTFVFSATLSVPPSVAARLGRRHHSSRPPSGPLEQLMAKVTFASTPKLVDLTSSTVVAANLLEAAVDVEEDDKDSVLFHLVRAHPGRCMVFTSTIAAARRAAALLVTLGVKAQALHAGMQQRQRLKALDRFKAARDDEGAREPCVLVSTDVAARGLDIPDVRLVVHYQLPQSADTYVHRAGRTARANRDGASLVMVGAKDRGKYVALCRALGRDGVMSDFPMDPQQLASAGKAVRLAEKIDAKDRVLRREKAEDSWARRTAEAAGIELDDDELEAHEREESTARDCARARKAAAEVKKLRAQLSKVLAAPVEAMPRTHIAREAGGLAKRWKVSASGQLALAADTREEAVETLRRAQADEVAAEAMEE